MFKLRVPYLKIIMSDEPTNNPQDISKDLFVSKVEIKKIFQTFMQIFKNVKVVVDDFYYNKGIYTRPVKYTMAIIAPYLILIQVLDLAAFMMDMSIQSSDTAAFANDPVIMEYYNRFILVMSGYSKLTQEFLPLFYALVIAPILAYWLKKFFKIENHKFSYYYAFAIYNIITITSITLILFLSSYFGLFNFNIYMTVSAGITIFFLFFGINATFKGTLFKKLVKSILVLGLSFISLEIILIIVIGAITVITV